METLTIEWIDDNGFVDTTELIIDDDTEDGDAQDLLTAMTAASYAKIEKATTMDRLSFTPTAATAGAFDAADKLFVPYQNDDKQYFVQVPAPKPDILLDSEKADNTDSRLTDLDTQITAVTAGAYGTKMPAYRSRRYRQGLRK